ncbi:MAG: hypothetical protein JO281_16675, partial [Pseudonocardiales bacterium]|nr:hypothetical protein [Pseudonocardiales bacterium]
MGERSAVGGEGCWEPQFSGELAGRGPEQEAAQASAPVFGVLGVPGVDVGLLAGVQGVLVCGESVEEGGGWGDLIVGELSTGGGDRCVRGAGPESGQDFAGGEALDELGAVGVG